VKKFSIKNYIQLVGALYFNLKNHRNMILQRGILTSCVLVLCFFIVFAATFPAEPENERSVQRSMKRQVKPDAQTGFVPIGDYGNFAPRFPPGLVKNTSGKFSGFISN